MVLCWTGERVDRYYVTTRSKWTTLVLRSWGADWILKCSNLQNCGMIDEWFLPCRLDYHSRITSTVGVWAHRGIIFWYTMLHIYKLVVLTFAVSFYVVWIYQWNSDDHHVISRNHICVKTWCGCHNNLYINDVLYVFSAITAAYIALLG